MLVKAELRIILFRQPIYLFIFTNELSDFNHLWAVIKYYNRKGFAAIHWPLVSIA